MSPNLHSAIKSQVSALLLRCLFRVSGPGKAKKFQQILVLMGRRWVFMQTEASRVLGMDLDRGDNTHTFIRSDSPPLLTRNSINQSPKLLHPVPQPCLQGLRAQGLQRPEKEAPPTRNGSMWKQQLLSHGHMPTWSLLLVATTVIQGARCSFLRNRSGRICHKR
ncbi:Phosphatidylinositol 4-kinase gamma 5 [Zea mays]|uniref:Phosphatidylinositol 4-kinase gamma 5 n=1 Tax=Zea mays TaxID=4577 RepID=A0A3L6D7R9_MAIZE|nr:Phosphatidylinositol 4-kinase gamma 5 [Zea mays]